MRLVVCIDQNKGTMFNHRRQSQDRILRERILEISKGERLWMTPYSARQFEADADIIVDDECHKKAKKKDYYFFEDGELDIEDCIEIIVYNWNRHYPADRFFNYDLRALGFELASVLEFAGYSHEKITEERFVRGKK